jgi:hypothetical protein
MTKNEIRYPAGNWTAVLQLSNSQNIRLDDAEIQCLDLMYLLNEQG